MGKEAKQGVVGVIGFVWLEETEEIHQGLQLLPRAAQGQPQSLLSGTGPEECRDVRGNISKRLFSQRLVGH